MKIHLTITTYNRPVHLRQLLDDIEREKGDMDLSCHIYNDGGKKPPGIPPWATLINRFHGGKYRYWHMITAIFKALPEADHYIQLPDDFRLCEGFFTKLIAQWKTLKDNDPKAACLNPFLDGSRIGKVNWTDFVPEIHQYDQTRYFKTQWNDLCYIADIDMFKALKRTINKIDPKRWQHDPLLSSGVGWQLSRRLHELGWNMYQCRESLVEHEGDSSQMNPVERKTVKLRSGKLDRVIVGIATIPGREGSFKKAVDSVLPYCDEIHIAYNSNAKSYTYLNGPDNSDKFIEYLAPLEIADHGDAGKFFAAGCDPEPHYFITIDDDIEYPPDFIWRIIGGIEMRDRKAVVGYHGKVLENAPVSSFYSRHIRKEIYHCRSHVKKAAHVNLIGTGCTGYHSDTLPEINWDIFKKPNMADIWFSMYCQKRNIPMVVLKHRPLKVDLSIDDTIFDRHQNGKDKEPTKAYNSYRNWRVI